MLIAAFSPDKLLAIRVDRVVPLTFKIQVIETHSSGSSLSYSAFEVALRF